MVLLLINLKTTVLTYAIANFIYFVLQLYHILFSHLLNNDPDIKLYINGFKAITTRMTTKPLLFKHYMMNISFT